MRRLILAAVAVCCLWPADLYGQAIAVSLAGRAMPSRLTADSLRWDDEVVAAALTACPVARGTTYYVDPAGSDVAAGTSTGTAWATISRAQTALTASSGNVAILFKRGGQWKEAVGLTIAKNNVTIGAYGTGARPRLSAFINSFASGGTLWTLASGARYTTSVAAIGGIREQLNIYKAYRVVTSTAAVESTANSYYHDGSLLHVHATNAAGTAVDPDTIAYEYTLASATDDSGIDVSSGYTGTRIDGVECHGWGLDGGSVNQEYGIKVQANSTNVACVTNCGGYYCARHTLGHNPGSGASGGLVVWINCDAGYCTENFASPFVCYAGQGAWEDIFLGCTTMFGALPTEGVTVPNGIALYAHSDSDTYRFALLLVKDHIVRAPANGFGCHAGVQFANAPTATGAGDCKAILVNTTFERIVGGGASGYIGHTFATPNSVEIGGNYRFVPLNMSIDAMSAVAATGWLIGTSVEIDLTNAGMTESIYGMINAGTTTINPKFWHCHFRIISNGTTDFALPIRAAWDTAAVADVEGEFINSIFSVIRTDPSTSTSTTRASADVIRCGINNSAERIRNSAFFNDSANGTYIGRSNAVNTVELASAPAFGGVGQTATQLAGVGRGGVAEIDGLLRSRHPTAPSIGPLELASQDLQRPTAAELVTLLEASAVGTNAATAATQATLALKPVVDGRELIVDAEGHAEVDVIEINNSSAAAQTLDTHLQGTTAWTVTLAAGAITESVIATDAITADALAADAIGSSEFAATAEVQTGLATAAVLGTPAGASIAADVAAIEAQTDDIGVAGAGLTAITASLSPVSADVVGPSYTWIGKRYRATNIVEVESGYIGPLALAPDMNPGVTIATVDSVTITGAATVTATDLSTDRSRTKAVFTVPALSTEGTYTVRVKVTTVENQQITTTGTMKVY